RVGAHRRAGAREGLVGGAGDRAPDPPEPARGVPAPGLLGRGHDERLLRELRLWAAHAGYEPGLARARAAGAATVVPVGVLLRKQGSGRGRADAPGRPAAGRALPAVARLERCR